MQVEAKPLDAQPTRLSQTDWRWKWGLRLLSLGLTVIGWEIFARLRPNILFPNFSDSLFSMAGLFAQANLWQALWISNQALALGFGLALLVGVPTGFALGRWSFFDKSFNPYLAVLLVTPMAALIPLLIGLTGLGLTSRVLVVFIFAVPFIMTNARLGVRQLDPQLIEMTRSFGVTEVQLWWKVLIPASSPALLTGVRVGLGRAITAMVLADFLLSAEGLGKLLLEFQGTFQSASVYAVMFIVVLESLILLRLVKWVEQRWRRNANGVVV